MQLLLKFELISGICRLFYSEIVLGKRSSDKYSVVVDWMCMYIMLRK